MKLLFVHDHKFRRVNGQIYTTGGLSNETLRRYTQIADNVVIYARVVDENAKEKQWSLIKEKVTVLGDSSLSGNRLEEAVQDSDAVIVRLPSFLGNKACHLVAKYHKPYMIELVGCAWDSMFNHGVAGKILALYGFFTTRKHVRNAPYVLYVTETFLQKRYPTAGKNIGCSDVLIGDVVPEILNNRIAKIRRRTGPRIIGTTAAVDVRYKGQEYVIKALGILKRQGITGFEYHLAGNGDPHYLMRVARRENVEDQVVFLGGLPHEKIFAWLDSIDIYIQPSLQEGLPRALVEAQSRALPCFGSRTGGIPELLHEDCICGRRGSLETAIAKKLFALTADREIDYAKYAFDKAKEYGRHILDEKRTKFYNAFASSVQSRLRL